MALDGKQHVRLARSPGILEKEEARLWRVALMFLVLLATALAALSWEHLQSLPVYVRALPVALLCVTASFSAFAYGRRKRVSELKDLVRGLQEKAGTPT